jgi:jumonji domain-containing protein 7
VLLSPVEMPCVNEQQVWQARYVPKEKGDDSELVIEKSEESETLPFATWDPDEPEVKATRFSLLARPLRVTLEEGDMLYLPAMWYHKVSQKAGEEGFACAVNYWFDMEFGGGFWTTNSFLRDVAAASLAVR